MRCEKTIDNEVQMRNLGERLAEHLNAGDFIALSGNMGAGKSELVRGAARYFGIDSLTSPTFTIVQEYPAKIPFFHFDVYRIQDEDELLAIGFDDYLNRDGIIFMEWADLVPGLLPNNRLDICLNGSGNEPRKAVFVSYGEYFDKILEKL